MRGAFACGLALLVGFAGCVVCSAQVQRDLTMWQLPTSGALPTDIVSTSTVVYTTLFTSDTLGILDLQSDIMEEIAIGDGPYALTIKDDTIYIALALGDQFVIYKPAKSTVFAYPTPTLGGWPESLSIALTNFSAAHFAISERLVGRVAYFEMDMLQIPDGEAVHPTATTHLAKQTIQIQPRIVTVQPNIVYAIGSSSGAAAPQTQATLTKSVKAPFTEWQVTTGGAYLEDVDVDTFGIFWMARGDDTLVALNPWTSLASDYALSTGTVAMAVDASASAFGHIFFLDGASGAIGEFNTANGTLTYWPIPGAQHVVDIARDPRGSIWFADRGADVVGLLDRGSGTFTLYDLPPDSSPIRLDIAQGGINVWFVAERADYIGRLGVPLGP